MCETKKPTADSDFALAELPTGLPHDFDFSECVIDGVPVDSASIVQNGPGGHYYVAVLDYDERLWQSEPCSSLEEAQRALRTTIGIALA